MFQEARAPTGEELQGLLEKTIAAIEQPALIAKILTHLGLPARAPPRSPARPLALFQAASPKTRTALQRR